MASERDAAIQAAYEICKAEIQAAGRTCRDAFEAADLAYNRARNAAIKARDETLADIDRDYPEEGR